jgi:hypothetical protein
MVEIIGFQQRTNEEGESFNVLELMGGLELIKSRQTGQFYATARKTSIASTFDNRVCKELIGTKLPGKIERVSCEPYEFNIPGTEEVVMLSHTYRYDAQLKTAEEEIYSEEKVKA